MSGPIPESTAIPNRKLFRYVWIYLLIYLFFYLFISYFLFLYIYLSIYLFIFCCGTKLDKFPWHIHNLKVCTSLVVVGLALYLVASTISYANINTLYWVNDWMSVWTICVLHEFNYSVMDNMSDWSTEWLNESMENEEWLIK